jgi:hypothetical protein
MIVLPLAAAAGACIDAGRYPAAILLGGIVGLFHLQGIRITSRAATGMAPSTGLLWVFSVFRLLIVAMVLGGLVKFAGIDVLGLLGGLMLVHLLVLVEGWLDARESLAEGDDPPGDSTPQ